MDRYQFSYQKIIKFFKKPVVIVLSTSFSLFFIYLLIKNIYNYWDISLNLDNELKKSIDNLLVKSKEYNKIYDDYIIINEMQNYINELTSLINLVKELRIDLEKIENFTIGDVIQKLPDLYYNLFIDLTQNNFIQLTQNTNLNKLQKFDILVNDFQNYLNDKKLDLENLKNINRENSIKLEKIKIDKIGELNDIVKTEKTNLFIKTLLKGLIFGYLTALLLGALYLTPKISN